MSIIFKSVALKQSNPSVFFEEIKLTQTQMEIQTVRRITKLKDYAIGYQEL
jgi:hypothetical protein